MRIQSWNDLQDRPVPRWLKDAKFGIYTHWGVYSVPACGPNATWYAYNMYREGSAQHRHHVARYGDPSRFGYKDFIPQFTAERFDADAWADLFRRSGARFAGPVGEHHDGFAMWDSSWNPWNAKKMGPKRDVVGELEKAIRGQGLRFMTAMHHAETWWFYPHWKTRYDVGDPRFASFYGEPHDLRWKADPAAVDPDPTLPNHNESWPDQAKPSRAFLDAWLGKVLEIADRYGPDLLWYDFGLKWVQEDYRREMVSSFYAISEAAGREAVITYKWNDLPPGCGVEDIEQGKREDLAYNFWITDTNADAGEAWGHIEGNRFKTPRSIVHYLVDNVSKNGALLLSLGPLPDGTIREEERAILEETGRWLAVNGEAIYGTRPWTHSGEGPTKATKSGAFSEAEELRFTPKDFRYTVKDDCLYAICLGRPVGEIVLTTAKTYLYPEEVRSVRMLGVDKELAFGFGEDGLRISVPDRLPCDHAVTFRIERKHPFRAG
jgi:alpha-L-fucosidase